MKHQLISLFFSIAFISFLSNELLAQIIYTDINPDTLISAPVGNIKTYYLDLNNNGINDFYFKHFYPASTWNEVEAYTYIGQLGEILTNSGTSPCVLNNGILISSTSNIWICTASGSSSSALFMFPGWLGASDKYMGLRIKINNNWHYGWIRFTVFSDSSGFIIKDYAYESTPNLGITAGNTTSSINIINELFNKITIYPNPANDFIKADYTSLENIDYKIYNVLGIETKSGNFDKNNKTIILNSLKQGIYIIEFSLNNVIIQRSNFIKQ